MERTSSVACMCPVYITSFLSGYKWRVLFLYQYAHAGALASAQLPINICLLHQSTQAPSLSRPHILYSHHHTLSNSSIMVQICNMFSLLFITAVVHVLCWPLMCESFPVLATMDDSAAEQSQLEQKQLDQLEQEQYACLLGSNRSLVEKFQQSVREKHGISDPSYGMMCILIG